MKIAILTNFMEFLPGYSLTGIVKDQVEMLTRFGHEVHLFVNAQYNGEDFPGDVRLRKEIPFTHLIDYTSKKDISAEHKMIVNQTAVMVARELSDFDFIYTHDFLFTGWFMPYGLGLLEASKQMPKPRWLHWLHSIPNRMSDWWLIKDYGQNHKLVYPNESDRLMVAEQYRGAISDVRVIPHIKDIRTFFDFGEDTRQFIDDYPGVLQADVVQILPASTDRLSAKRVDKVIRIFSEIKQRGFSVCLVVANQWATCRTRKEDVSRFMKIAKRSGLVMHEEIIFTSHFADGKYDVGIPKKMLRELFLLSNLFVFPTREESFGLVVPEASLAGGVLLVLNRSLAQQVEISGMTGIYFDFGSFNHTVHHENEGAFLKDVAMIILGRIRENESIIAKTFMRQIYNMDSLYRRVYEPIMGEAASW